MMCGPAGSGKSTVATAMESSSMVRLSFDQAAWERGIRTMPLPAPIHREIERELRDRLRTLVAAGVDVVLDFSFWSRAMRDDYRALVRELGVEPETIYVTTERAVALDRIHRRGMAHGDDFALDPDLAARYFDAFEPPSADEGPLTVVSGSPTARQPDDRL